MAQQSEFDFNDFNERVQKRRDEERAEAEAGRKALHARLELAEAKRAEVDEEIVGLKEQISVINAFLGDIETEAEKSQTPRDSGVKKTLGIIAPKIDRWEFDVVVDAVREFKPLVKEASVRSALNRLVRNGVLSVEGFRSDRRWTYVEQKTELEQEAKAEDTDQESYKDDDVTAYPKAGTDCSVCGLPQYRAPGGDVCANGHGGAPPAEKKRDLEAIVSNLQSMILNAADQYDDGVSPKILAAIMDGAWATDEQFQAAIEGLVEKGLIEEGESTGDEGGHVLRKPAEPGSKEELKRTHVQGRMGFPGMEKPSHL